jgi:hypothetical protein
LDPAKADAVLSRRNAMPLSIELFENGDSLGTFDFEAPPRLNERLQIQGKGGAWRVKDVRHFAVPNAPAQLQIANRARSGLIGSCAANLERLKSARPPRANRFVMSGLGYSEQCGLGRAAHLFPDLRGEQSVPRTVMPVTKAATKGGSPSPT